MPKLYYRSSLSCSTVACGMGVSSPNHAPLFDVRAMAFELQARELNWYHGFVFFSSFLGSIPPRCGSSIGAITCLFLYVRNCWRASALHRLHTDCATTMGCAAPSTLAYNYSTGAMVFAPPWDVVTSPHLWNGRVLMLNLFGFGRMLAPRSILPHLFRFVAMTLPKSRGRGRSNRGPPRSAAARERGIGDAIVWISC